MSAKVPARVRAAAVQWLRCAHDGPWRMHKSREWLGIKLGSPEFDLTIEAMGAASYRFLEAAALLEDGWCPGDPVEVRR